MKYLIFIFSLLPVVSHAETAPDKNAAATVLIDFKNPDIADQWRTVNDNVMGGRSSGGPVFENGRLIFSGIINTNGGGFSSIRTKEQAWPAAANADGLVIRFRGDGRTYNADLRSLDRARGMTIAYRANFKTVKGADWQEVRIPFADFAPTWRGQPLRGEWAKPLDRARIGALGFMLYDKLDGPFRLTVDSIGVYTNRS